MIIGFLVKMIMTVTMTNELDVILDENDDVIDMPAEEIQAQVWVKSFTSGGYDSNNQW